VVCFGTRTIKRRLIARPVAITITPDPVRTSSGMTNRIRSFRSDQLNRQTVQSVPTVQPPNRPTVQRTESNRTEPNRTPGQVLRISVWCSRPLFASLRFECYFVFLRRLLTVCCSRAVAVAVAVVLLLPLSFRSLLFRPARASPFRLIVSLSAIYFCACLFALFIHPLHSPLIAFFLFFLFVGHSLFVLTCTCTRTRANQTCLPPHVPMCF